MSDVALLPAGELLRRLGERLISSRELLDLYLKRIETLDPKINSVVTLDAERARKRADEADAARARGESWGALHGLPMTIKDVFEVSGVRTTAGSPTLSEHVPATNAVVAQRLLDAGAILFGKTNVPLFAGDVQSYNEIFGTTNNPWDPARTPGGSSGGSAAALAAGFTSVEYGSDIGGSIRHPANWVGVYGHKPSWNIVPNRGHIPGPPGALAEPDLGVVGPMARSAEDLALLLELTAGPLPEEAGGWKLALPPPRRSRLQDYRVAAWLDDPICPVDAEIGAALRRTVEALRQAGVAVEETKPANLDFAQVIENYMRLLMPIILTGFPLAMFEQMKELAPTLPATDRTGLGYIARFGTETHRDWIIAHELRQHHRARMAEHFERFDVLLCPVSPVAAIAHDHSDPMSTRTIQVNGKTRPYFDIFSWIAVATSTLLPATVAPVGRTASGLPVGVQIVGPYLEDYTTIDFARRLADVVGGFQAPPGL
jgi:amidase